MSTAIPPMAQVTHIQQYMPTNEEIRRESVLAVEFPDDINSGKLGVTDWATACETCDGFLQECPGHFGHLELPLPCFRAHFTDRLVQILNCICLQCQRPRIPPELYPSIMKLPAAERLEALVKESKSYKSCHTPPLTKLEQQAATHCGATHYEFEVVNKKKDGLFLQAIVPLTNEDYVRYNQDRSQYRPPTLSPQQLYDALCLIPPFTLNLLGCNQYNLPKAHMWTAVPVSPHNCRPSHTFGGLGHKKKSFNDLTKYLRQIVVERNKLREVLLEANDRINLCVYRIENIVARDYHCVFRYGFCDKATRDSKLKMLKEQEKQFLPGGLELGWQFLNHAIASSQSRKHKKFYNRGVNYGRTMDNIEDIFHGNKDGFLRQNATGCRVDNSARSVIEGSYHMYPDQAGIPQRMAMSLGKKVYVQAYNFCFLQTMILNGPYVYPGCNFLTFKNGEEINLAYFENRRDIDLTQVRFVRRHLIDGDLVLINRQPTLHRPSMMTFRVKVIPGCAIRLHYAVFKPLGADCDGDEVNVHLPELMEAQAELQIISTVENNIMKNGSVWICFIQDAIAGAYVLSDPELRLTFDQMQRLVSSLPDCWHFPDPDLDGGQHWSCAPILSLLFPADFTLKMGQEINIIKGQWQREAGRLNNKTLNSRHGILSHLYRDYGGARVLQFLFEGYLLFQTILDIEGLSAGYFDTTPTGPYHPRRRHRDWCLNQIRQARDLVTTLNDYVQTNFPDHSPQHERGSLIENNLKEHMDTVMQHMTATVYNYHKIMDQPRKDNGLLILTQAGAKGSATTLAQMGGLVGPVYVLYGRYHHHSSHYASGEGLLERYGWITQPFALGVSLRDCIYEAHAATESVVKKNKTTSFSGYTVRKLTNGMMGVVADQWRRAVNTRGQILWNHYGYDGYSAQKMVQCPVRVLLLSETQIETQYFQPATLLKLRYQYLKALSQQLGGNPNLETLNSPLHWSHLLDRVERHEGSLDPHEWSPSLGWLATYRQQLWDRCVQTKLIVPHNQVLQLLVWDWLDPHELQRRGLGLVELYTLGRAIVRGLAQALIDPGESIGILASESLGEPFTQLYLKTPHFSGKLGVVTGATKINHLLECKYEENASMKVPVPQAQDEKDVIRLGLALTRTYVCDLCLHYPQSEIRDQGSSLWVAFAWNRPEVLRRQVNLLRVACKMGRWLGLDPADACRTSYCDADQWLTEWSIPTRGTLWTKMKKILGLAGQPNTLPIVQYLSTILIHNLFTQCLVHGQAAIANFMTEKVQCYDLKSQTLKPVWTLTTLGSNLKAVLRLPGIDPARTYTSNIFEMQETFGLLVARHTLEHEIRSVMNDLADPRHIQIITRMMTAQLTIHAMKRNQVMAFVPPLQQANFEQTSQNLIRGCASASIDEANTLCGAAMSNKLMNIGTRYNCQIQIPPFVPVPTPKITDYVFSFKVDGTRVFLTFFQTREGQPIINMVTRKNQVLSLPATNRQGWPGGLFHGTILDGDWVPPDPPTRPHAIFTIFDCLMSAGNRSSVLRYDQRLEIAREIVFRLATRNGQVAFDTQMPLEMGLGHPLSPTLPISLRPRTSQFGVKVGDIPCLFVVKPIFALQGLNLFEKIIKPQLSLPMDGYVFTSLSQAAQPFRKAPTSLFKWKPREENTIDVMLKRRQPEDHLTLWAKPKLVRQFQSATGEYAMWAAAKPQPQLFGFLDTSEPVVEHGIYECQWNFQTKTWSIYRVRQKSANTVPTIIATLKNLVDNISLAEFQLSKI